VSLYRARVYYTVHSWICVFVLYFYAFIDVYNSGLLGLGICVVLTRVKIGRSSIRLVNHALYFLAVIIFEILAKYWLFIICFDALCLLLLLFVFILPRAYNTSLESNHVGYTYPAWFVWFLNGMVFHRVFYRVIKWFS